MLIAPDIDQNCFPLCRLASTPAMFNSTITEDDAFLCPVDGSIMITGTVHMFMSKLCDIMPLRVPVLLFLHNEILQEQVLAYFWRFDFFFSISLDSPDVKSNILYCFNSKSFALQQEWVQIFHKCWRARES